MRPGFDGFIDSWVRYAKQGKTKAIVHLRKKGSKQFCAYFNIIEIDVLVGERSRGRPLLNPYCCSIFVFALSLLADTFLVPLIRLVARLLLAFSQRRQDDDVDHLVIHHVDAARRHRRFQVSQPPLKSSGGHAIWTTFPLAVQSSTIIRTMVR